ncbi:MULTISPECIES: enoyl-CoA hydratase/isomerase family protein [unclassified Nocardioides]|uniref:enoyl-CoA hydratase/isomerase family protein n=1 Tax=unclassified Nocardioides TaxID=2615069 RepID=UPI0006F72BBF|nr:MULTISPECIES: enoyl-CoA hydratase-related protein [unclassified Nocardioides]KQY57614.1 enoyl-CoA hydratase [Nocardioides sp. Root140]KQZ76017.1 enoyl-CoA hydratase [Nocardioides sp. Root151]KRF15090.1 enoyl-CoA hydratase [Nocardioides sp. Soil796]
MDYDTLLVDVTDAVAFVTINRPDVRNAVSREVQDDVRAFLARARTDEKIGAVVFTGAGEKAFVAGADISQLADYTLHTGLASEMQRLYDEVEAFEKPTVAAVNGFALGGGCELAMACDIRIASDNARFGLPETNLSVLPGAGGTQRLARLIGTGRAIEMILTGRMMPADEALAAGLVTSVVPRGDLLTKAAEVAGQILAKGPLAVRLAKLVVRTGMDADQHTGLVVERLAQALLYTSDDKREGTEAFLAKRRPAFTGS